MLLFKKLFFFVILVASASVGSYKLNGNYAKISRAKILLASTSTSVADIIPTSSGNVPVREFKKVAISGFASSSNNFADNFVPLSLFAKDFTESIKVLTDNVKFARKRLVSPATVYSGLADVILFEEFDTNEDSISNALQGTDAWIAFNVTSSLLPIFAAAAVKSSVKRVVFAVQLQNDESGPDVCFSPICEQLSAAGVLYTIVKYGELRPMGEGKYPYRIVRGALPIPSLTRSNSPVGSFPLSTQDLYRVLAEAVDLPKTYNNVYGIGPGTTLDSEILIYMKSQGWPERIQVGLLMGDMMEKIEQKYEALLRGQRSAAESGAAPVAAPAAALPSSGFFSN